MDDQGARAFVILTRSSVQNPASLEFLSQMRQRRVGKQVTRYMASIQGVEQAVHSTYKSIKKVVQAALDLHVSIVRPHGQEMILKVRRTDHSEQRA